MSWGPDDDYFGDQGGTTPRPPGAPPGGPGAGDPPRGQAPPGRPPTSWRGNVADAAALTDDTVKPAIWLLVLALLISAAGLLAAGLQLGSWPGLLAAWLLGGVLGLVLVVWFVHTDIRRRATGMYLASPVIGLLQPAAALLAVAAVVLAAVRFALLAGHGGVW